MRFNNPLELGWQLNVLDLIMLSSTLIILIYSIREYRRGRPTYLVLYLACLAYGLIMEFTTGMMISRSYLQGEFTVMVETTKWLGYATDMPLYVMVGFYPVTIFLGFKLIEAFGIRSIVARALSVGVFMLLIDAPYEVNGTQRGIDWWTWLDWKISGRAMFQYWYGWPMSEAWWQLTFPGLLMFMVWRWERRRGLSAAVNDQRAVSAVTSTPWKTLLVTPVALGVAINVLGLVASSPIGIAIGLGVPHYVLIGGVTVAFAAVLLYSAKEPVGLDRVGWTLLAVYFVGYSSVVLSTFAFKPIPGGQITIASVTLSTLVVLAAYPGHLIRRQQVSLVEPALPTTELTEVA